MKIAIPYENGQVFQHFGHTAQFKLYDVENGAVVSSKVVDTNGSGHGALAGFLMQRGVDTLICGGIGGGAQMALAEAGIKLYGGVSGEADAAVNALLASALAYDPNVRCDHHDHAHEEDEHHHDHDHEDHEHHHDHDHEEHEHHHDHDHECGCGCGHHHHDHEGHHHADDVFTSWGKETIRTYTKEEIGNILKTLEEDGSYGNILRAKGMVAGADGEWIYFDMVPGEHEVRTGAPEYTGRICVIGAEIKEDKLAELFQVK